MVVAELCYSKMSVAMAAAAVAGRRLGVPRSDPFVGLSLRRRRLPFFFCSRFPLQAVCYRTFLHKSFPVLQGRTRALLPVVVVNSSSSSAAALPETQQVSQQQQRGSAGIVSEVLEFTRRSHLCGTLGEEQVGESVCICGWVASQRSHGAVAFVNLRDHTGIVQVMGVLVFFSPLHICPFFSLSLELVSSVSDFYSAFAWAIRGGFPCPSFTMLHVNPKS